MSNSTLNPPLRRFGIVNEKVPFCLILRIYSDLSFITVFWTPINTECNDLYKIHPEVFRPKTVKKNMLGKTNT